MENATILVLLALLQYIFFTAKVGGARGKYSISAPACTGDENFERVFRVQQNTMEQLVVFIPATYAFAYYVSAKWVWIPGLIYLVSRFIYSSAYTGDPSKRSIGMIGTLLSSGVMVLGALGFIIFAKI